MAVTIGLLFGSPAATWAQVAPVNDNLADAIEIVGDSGTLSGTNILATMETNEPDPYGDKASSGAASVWWKWTAPPDCELAAFDTIGSDFDTVLGIYVDSTSPPQLPVEVGEGFEGSNFNNDAVSIYTGVSRLVFEPTPNTTYYIIVDGYTAETGQISLNWESLPPGNDHFADAYTIVGDSGTTQGFNLTATMEAGEPTMIDSAQTGASVWWVWTAPFSDMVNMDLGGSNFDTVLGVFTGTALDNLLVVAEHDGTGTSAVRFAVTQGTTYYIYVAGFDPIGFPVPRGNISLQWARNIAPTNDDLVNAIEISGSSGSTTGTNVAASKEASEPDSDGMIEYYEGGASVWWKWTAPTNEQVSFDTFGSNFDTMLGIYTDPTVPPEFPLEFGGGENDQSGGDQSSLIFKPTANETYYICVDGYSGQIGQITLNWETVIPPGNDNFEDAYTLIGDFGTTQGTNHNAGGEASDPAIASNSTLSTVWWKWTATYSGQVTFDLRGSSIDTLLGAFTGSSLNTLTSMAENDDFWIYQSAVSFAAAQGTTYYLLVDGFAGTRGDITLNWSSIRPANDDFADATVIINGNGSSTGTNTNASNEAGDPASPAGHFGGGLSIWWRWSPPHAGTVTFGAGPNDFKTELGVYTGALGSLTTIGEDSSDCCSDHQPSVTFNVTEADIQAGTSYMVLIKGANPDNQGPQYGTIELEWSGTTPVNLSGFSVE